MRNGISGYASKEQYDLLGEKTYLRGICEGLVKNTVMDGSWFTFCTKADKDRLDILSIKNDKGDKLGSLIASEYEFCSYRTAIYKYLLRDFMCYYECPIVKRDYNATGVKNSFNKYLITSNIHVVALWLGISVEDAEAQYGARLFGVDDLENDDDLFPYLKLYETKDHIRKITKPRKDIDLSESGTRIIPIFALKAGVDILHQLLQEDTYNVEFCKDSGQVRTINTTFNLDKIREVYEDDYINLYKEELYKGNFINNPTLERGYIRVFEMGSSIYDNPLRAINYARIVSFEKAEPDLAYIYVDIDSVVDTFKDYLYASEIDVKELVDMLDVFEVGTTRSINNLRLMSLVDIETWVETQQVLLSTVFLRQLSLFMLGNPQWFKGYTGAPKAPVSSEDYSYSDNGMANLDDDELAIG